MDEGATGDVTYMKLAGNASEDVPRERTGLSEYYVYASVEPAYPYLPLTDAPLANVHSVG